MSANKPQTDSKADVRNMLGDQSKEGLVILAKKLRVHNARKLSKSKLIEQILLLPESNVRRALHITWWDKQHNHVYGVVGILGLLLAAVSVVYVFVPKVSVQTERTSTAKDPFESAFVLKNESLLSVREVELSYIFNNIEGIKDFPEAGLKSQRTRVGGGIRAKSLEDKQVIPSLVRGESTFLVFPQRFLDEYTYCDIQIEVSYRPAFAFWRQAETFRFVSRKEKDALVWYQKANSEPVYFSPNSNEFLHIMPFPGSDPRKIILNRVDPK